ncbi:hypothetical protein UPYG_G00229120 [Umbra pygmaea]|uniref:Saposin B-type domain-containing protein n=1 Tax=Umbra pygmaea TaxID=75934 RepID=A0ABD0WXF2_UMBPY
MSPVIGICLLLVYAAFGQASMSPGGTDLMEKEMCGSVLKDRHAEIKDALPGMCGVCKKIIQTLEKKVANNEAKDKIAAKLNAFCDSMKFLKGTCRKLVNKYKDKVIDAISKHLNATVVCRKWKLCK